MEHTKVVFEIRMTLHCIVMRISRYFQGSKYESRNIVASTLHTDFFEDFKFSFFFWEISHIFLEIFFEFFAFKKWEISIIKGTKQTILTQIIVVIRETAFIPSEHIAGALYRD